MGSNVRVDAPHLLFLAFFFPPSRASGVYRALAITKAFVDAGWRVTVVTTTRQFFLSEIGSVDESLVDDIPDGVDVVRIPFTLWKPPIQGDLCSVNWLWGNYPTLKRYAERVTTRVRDIAKAIVAGAPSPRVNENYADWVGPAFSAGCRVNSTTRVDHVLATGNPFSSFEAARLISQATGIPFSVDYRDPWTFDLFTGQPKTIDAGTATAEKRIIDSAANVFHVNEPIARAYSSRLPATAPKHHVVRNGFDLESIGPVPTPEKHGPLRFGMVGTITDKWPLQEVLNGWSDALPHLPEGSELLLAGHLGYFGDRSPNLRETVDTPVGGYSYLGPLQKREVASFYAGLDVVVVPIPKGEMVTSGKIYEALAIGIPLVCVQPRGGGARTLLDEHPLAFGAEPRRREVSQSLIAAASAARRISESDIKQIRATMMRYERQASIAPMVEFVSSATTSTRQPAS